MVKCAYQPKEAPARPTTSPSSVPTPTPPSTCECAEARAEQIVADNAGRGEADSIRPVIAAPARAHGKMLPRQDDRLRQSRGSGNALGQLIVAGDEMVDLALQAGEPARDFARRSEVELVRRVGRKVAARIGRDEMRRRALRLLARARGEARHGVGVRHRAEHLLVGARRRRSVAEGRRVGKGGVEFGPTAVLFAPLAEAKSPKAAPPFEAKACVPIAIEPVATAPVPMAMELTPVAEADAPSAMLVVPSPVALAPSPIAILALPSPLALADKPLAILALWSPLASAAAPVALLKLPAPLASAWMPKAAFWLLAPLASELPPNAMLALELPLALDAIPLAVFELPAPLALLS